jgi:hypothetical protein
MNISKKNKLKEKYFGYIEGITYILFIIVIVFTNIAGPIVIKLLPFVFILGIVGRIIYNRPLITSVFGFLVSLSSIYMLGTYTYTYNLMYSLFCFICILIGEVEGMYIIRLASSKGKNIVGKNSKNIAAFILLALAGIFLNNYINGNIFTYLRCKQVLESYISTNYNDSKNAIVTDGKYVFNKYKYYSFNVKNIESNDNKKYEFVVYLDNKIIDGYEKDKLFSDSGILKIKFAEDVDLSKYNSFDFNIEYNNVQNNITFYITKSVKEIKTEELNKFAEDVNNILDEISTFSEFDHISKINICIKDTENKLDAEIATINFYDKDYYVNSLETEYLDN